MNTFKIQLPKLLIFFSILLIGFHVSGQKSSTISGQKANKTNGQSANKVGIDFFHGTWEEAKKKAKEENKYIMVDAYASWCGPCKKMVRTTFADASVGRFYNENYINFKIDMEKGEGPALKNVFRVRAYPTIVYFDADAKEVGRFQGFRPAESFLVEGKKALVNKEEVMKMSQAFDGGERDPQFLREYIESLSYLKQPKDKVVKEYVKTQSKEDLKSPENMDLFFYTVNDIEDPIFELIMDNKAAYETKFGKKETNVHLTNLAITTFRKALQAKDTKLFQKTVDVVDVMDFDKKHWIWIQMNLEFHKKTVNWKEYVKVASEHLDLSKIRTDRSTADVLNNIAYMFYEHTDDPDNLAKAETWSRKSVQLKNTYHSQDTLAALLFKQGKNKEALEVANKAIEMAKKRRKNYKSTQELIEKYTGTTTPTNE